MRLEVARIRADRLSVFPEEGVIQEVNYEIKEVDFDRIAGRSRHSSESDRVRRIPRMREKTDALDEVHAHRTVGGLPAEALA